MILFLAPPLDGPSIFDHMLVAITVGSGLGFVGVVIAFFIERRRKK